jgi:hypothetical protein
MKLVLFLITLFMIFDISAMKRTRNNRDNGVYSPGTTFLLLMPRELCNELLGYVLEHTDIDSLLSPDEERKDKVLVLIIALSSAYNATRDELEIIKSDYNSRLAYPVKKNNTTNIAKKIDILFKLYLSKPYPGLALGIFKWFCQVLKDPRAKTVRTHIKERIPWVIKGIPLSETYAPLESFFPSGLTTKSFFWVVSDKAALQRGYEILKLLLQAGVSPNISLVEDGKQCPLIVLAVKTADIAIIGLILEKRAVVSQALLTKIKDALVNRRFCEPYFKDQVVTLFQKYKLAL